jgi:hypothetical protein
MAVKTETQGNVPDPIANDMSLVRLSAAPILKHPLTKGTVLLI